MAKTGKVISSKENFNPLNYMAKFTALSFRELKWTSFSFSRLFTSI